MGIHEEISAKLKAAMKDKDERVLNVLKMIRSTAKKTALTEGQELNDELYLGTIESYVKQMKRAQAEYEEAGEKGAELAAQLRFEIEYLQPFLPQMLDDAQTAELVNVAIAEAGIKDPKQAGRVVGLVMKSHRGSVDPGLVKKLAEKALSS
jgi:uncharacterized protein YqeY